MHEHPAGEPPRNPYEAQLPPPGQPGGAGGGGRAPVEGPPDYTRRGVMAALAIFAVVVVLHLVLLAFVKLSGDSNNVILFLPEGILVVVGALAAAIVVTLRLPMQSRVAFWAAGAACIFMSVIVWGATCALAM
jgi:hypothetical protein